MSRELKRVPLDFHWEIHRPYIGYINPYKAIKCVVCDGSGLSQEAQSLHNFWYGLQLFRPEQRDSTAFLKTNSVILEIAKRNIGYHIPLDDKRSLLSIQLEVTRLCGIFNTKWRHHLNQNDVDALIKAKRLYNFTHTFTKSGWIQKIPAVIPVSEEVNLWSISGLGHDAINSWICIEAECERLGYKSVCQQCQGSGKIFKNIEEEEKSRNWLITPPPMGEGYQIWETFSHSPNSPVFDTAEQLAKHMAITDWEASEEHWLEFILGPNLVPTTPTLIIDQNDVVASRVIGDKENTTKQGTLQQPQRQKIKIINTHRIVS